MKIYVVDNRSIQIYNVERAEKDGYILRPETKKTIFTITPGDDGEYVFVAKDCSRYTLVGACTLLEQRLTEEATDLTSRIQVMRAKLDEIVAAKVRLDLLAEQDMTNINTLLFSDAMPS
jgi:hypothetical protein